MPEKSLHFTKALQCKWLKSLAIYRTKVTELGSCMSAYYINLQFSHAYAHTFFAPQITKKITKHFQYCYKTKTKLKHRTHYATFQNHHICAYRLSVWLSALCGLCILPYVHGLRSALVVIAYRAVMWPWLV